MNFNSLHTFIKGLQGDFVNNTESNETFQKGINGRLVSENGVLSFSSIKGNKTIYTNNKILKYLGWEAYDDELIIFVKQECSEIIIPIDTSLNDCENEIINFDPTLLYSLNENVPNLKTCSNSSNISIPINNLNDNCDAIYSLKLNSQGIIEDKLLWQGYQNWSFDSKIVCLGIYETENIKSIYYTDFLNPFRKVNIKKSNVINQLVSDFDLFQNTVLIEPKFEQYISGTLYGMTVFYTYRLIAKNGQVTEFSPLSDGVIIPKKYEVTEFIGTDPEEITSFGVKLKCEILNTSNYIEVECFAIEYQSKNIPTAIRKLGSKSISGIVEFNHYGNEEEFSNSTTILDVIKTNNNWKYCSSLEKKNNKLIVGCLRNNPINSYENELKTLFKLRAWDVNRNTFDNCEYNPNPKEYGYIFPNFTENLILIKKRIYKSISVYGNFSIKLKNYNTGYEIEKVFSNSNHYNEMIIAIKDWLLLEYSQTLFQTNFYNLKIEYTDNQLIFSRVNETIDTDISNFDFIFSTLQYQIDVEYEYQYNTNIPSGLATHGAISYGFNSGTGIRITYQREKEKVLKKSTSLYNGASNDRILNTYLPNLKKGFFKDEIYRLFIELKSSGEKLFAIPLGDIHIPEINQFVSYLDDNGNIVISNEKYVNQHIENDDLYIDKTILKIEVRFDCKYKNIIDSYQLMYVERTEENRTILCQGLSAPLMKYQPASEIKVPYFSDDQNKILVNHWMLPYAGGPAFELNGFSNFDDGGGNNYDLSLWLPSDQINTNAGIQVAKQRVIYSRNLIYFDAPDIIYGVVSPKNISAYKLKQVSIVNTDMHPEYIASLYNLSDDIINTDFSEEIIDIYNFPEEIIFSRKINKSHTNMNVDFIETSYEGTPTHYWNNVTVFSEIDYSYSNEIVDIDSSVSLEMGTTADKSELGLLHHLSNNAMYVPMNQSWFYGRAQRCYGALSGGCGDRYAYAAIVNSVKAKGKSTVFIKTNQNIFTNSIFSKFINSFIVRPDIEHGYNDITITSNHLILNIYKNNDLNVYGGKTEQAFSNNIVIPLGGVIPLDKTSTAAQVNSIYGDTYTTLFVRTKTGFSDSPLPDETYLCNNGGTTCQNSENEDIPYYRKTQGGWLYAVVLETSIEPKLSYDSRTDLESKMSFDIESGDNILGGYLQQKNLKTSIPKPYRFVDNPNLENMMVVSNVKLNGDYFDAWSIFLPNEFQELDKKFGAIHNLVIDNSKLFAIQKIKTAYIGLDERNVINSDNGQIVINSGTGQSFTGYEYVSDYGTGIRRNAINKNNQITFFDELNNDIIRSFKPLLLENNNSLNYFEIFKNDNVIDVEIYYDLYYKETNLRLKTKSEVVYLLSYNEILKCFNGQFEYDHDVYMNFKNKVYAPKKSVINDKLYNQELTELNNYNYLLIDGSLKTLVIGFTCSIQPEINKIYKTIELITNIGYRLNFVKIKTNLNDERIISGEHFYYKIREGKHSIPLKNQMIEFDIDEYKDMRGAWAYIELNISSINNKKIDIFAVDVQLRKSYN
jgi:hypothetical protein